MDDSLTRRRLHFSTAVKDVKSTPLHVAIPLLQGDHAIQFDQVCDFIIFCIPFVPVSSG
jgi:hypothetical protein